MMDGTVQTSRARKPVGGWGDTRALLSKTRFILFIRKISAENHKPPNTYIKTQGLFKLGLQAFNLSTVFNKSLYFVIE